MGSESAGAGACEANIHQSVQACGVFSHAPFSPRLASQLLEDIGALDEREHLTSLGRHLAALPLPPALGERDGRQKGRWQKRNA